MIGQRLSLARAAAGLSLRDLQEKIGNLVSAQAIGKYERNESMPSSGVLIALASALDVSESYLLGDSEITLDRIEFRRKAGATKRDEARVSAITLNLLERYLAVEEVLNLPSQEWNAPREAPYPVGQLGEADRAAARLRSHWELGIDPIPDLMELLEEQGIKVLAIDQSGIDGLTAQVRRPKKNNVPVIVVNENDWHERQRFTLAHELGHLVMDCAKNIDEEKAAHRFAGAFLMPAEAIWSELGKHRTSISWGELFHQKEIFGVSVQALTYRCKDLGVFPYSLYRHLFSEFERLGWRAPPYQEPHWFAPRKPQRFERLCFRALAEQAISESRAAELLGLTVFALNKKMDEVPEVQKAQ